MVCMILWWLKKIKTVVYNLAILVRDNWVGYDDISVKILLIDYFDKFNRIFV